MPRNIGIIGDGNVGSALREGLERAGHNVRTTGHDPEKVRDVARWGEVVILAVPFGALEDVSREVGDAMNGKTVVDPTNVVASDNTFAIDSTSTSGAEQLQRMLPEARVVKAFNTVFAGHMSTGKAGGETLTLFVAGDYEDAKAAVRDLGRDVGFDAVDAGPLRNAAWMEGMGYFHMQLAQNKDLGRNVEFKLVR